MKQLIELGFSSLFVTFVLVGKIVPVTLIFSTISIDFFFKIM